MMVFRDVGVTVRGEMLAKGYKMSFSRSIDSVWRGNPAEKENPSSYTELRGYLEMPDLDLTSRVPHILRVPLKLSWRKEDASSFWLCATTSPLFFSFLPFGPKVSLCHPCWLLVDGTRYLIETA